MKFLRQQDLFLVALLALPACNGSVKAAPPYLYMTQSAADDFFVGEKLTGNSHLVWKRDGELLGIKNSARLLFNEKLLVMVSFSSSSLLLEQSLTDVRTLVVRMPDAKAPGFALYALNKDDPAELDQLAFLAHQTSGFACGSLEVIRTDLSLLTQVDYVSPPIYREDIALDSMASILDETSASNLRATIQTMQDQGSRYHTSASGLATTTLVEGFFQDAVNGALPAVTYEQKAQTYSDQKNLVVTLPGTDDDEAENIVIIGAHMDSIHNPDNTDAPGSDDDASGVATMVEAMRVIAAKGLHFKRTIEFHGYAAEEVGLLGSAELASSYRSDDKRVSAMFQIDMNSWSSDPKSQTIFLVLNDTDINLRRSLKDLMNTYLGGDYEEKALLAGTSDHKSWTLQGFASVFPFEDPLDYNEALHTGDDTLSTINNLDLSDRFTKLVLAFLAHYAGLVEGEDEYQAALAEKELEDDLALAVFAANDEGKRSFAVGTETSIAGLESCEIEDFGAAGCSDTRVKLSLLGEKSERAIFYLEDPIKLKGGQIRRFFGYGKSDELAFMRDVKLSEP